MKARSRSKPARKSGRGRSARGPAAARVKAVKSGVLALNAECTLAEAEALKTGLAALLDEPATVTLDAGAVQRVDTAALQLLAAFVRDRRLGGLATHWRACSPAMESAARLLGMDAMLSLSGAER